MHGINMKNSKKIVIGLMTAFLLLCAVIGTQIIQPIETSYTSVSSAYNYGDIEELAQNSDLIALVKVKGLVAYEDVTAGPFSTYEVEVIEPIYQCETGDKVKIFMTGGQNRKERIEVNGDPLMEKGQEFLVFTTKNQKRTDTYSILGGPQGRLSYENGKLYSLHYAKGSHIKSADSEAQFSVDIKDVPLHTMMDHINIYID